MKQCPECKKLGEGPKPLSEFNRKKTNADGLQRWCRTHTAAANRAYVKARPEMNRMKAKRFRETSPVQTRSIRIRTQLKRFYGLTEAQYAAIFAAQNGRCAVCDLRLVSQLDTRRPFEGQPGNNIARVDHCHTTGDVRGLLCFGCNVGLGKFKDDEEYLLRAVRYLRASATEPALGRVQRVKLQGESEPENRDLNRTVRRVSRREELSPF